MAKIERTLDGNNPVLKIDLAETLGTDNVPESVASDIGAAVIQKIISRTQEENVDKRDAPFKEYSTSYANSAIFKALGKSESNINLTGTGEMLDSLSVLNFDGRILEIGWNDPDQAAKAHGHITGKNGQVPKMKRDFFGLFVSDLTEIAEGYEGEAPDLRSELEDDLVNEILKDLSLSEDRVRALFRE